MTERIYLDHNATAPLDGEVLEAMMPYLRVHHGNASARHEEGRIARAAVDQAREQVAAAINAQPGQVVFTASGTEANNTIIKGIAAVDKRPILAIGAAEHPCVLCAARTAAQDGTHLMIPISCDAHGSYELGDLADSATAGKTALVSLMLANNETGAIQDIAAAAAIAHAAGAPMHTDAVQSLGKIEIDFAALGVDAMTLSAHKARGPKGVAALVVDSALEWAPLLEGGGQEDGRRSSTENVAGIVGFGKAAELAAKRVAHAGELAQMRDSLEERLHESGAVIFGGQAKRLPNTSYFAFPGIDGETLVMMLDQSGFAVASGSACSTFKDEPSPVLLAMGVDEALARCSVRVSLGADTTADAVASFAAAAAAVADRLMSMAATAGQ